MKLLSFSQLFWRSISLIFFSFFLLPVIFVLASLFTDYNDNWSHLINFVLTDYILNSIYLIAGVSILSLLFGVGTAWLVTNYDFLGRGWQEWALILPLAVPPYILAYTFTSLFDSYGSANEIMRYIFNIEDEKAFFPNVRNLYGAILVFSSTLYPYVYLTTRVAFLNQSRTLIESGKLLGLDNKSVFYKLALPMARPAIIAGLALVIMETLSDFGAVEHFAVPTFTIGIYRTWFGMYDLNTAMQLSSLLLIFVAIFLLVERLERNKLAYSYAGSTFKPINKIKLTGWKNYLAFIFCFVPLFLGFLLPILEISNWAINYTSESFFSNNFLSSFFNTIFLGLLAGIICTSFAFLFNFLKRFERGAFLKTISFVLSLGYAIPGLVLAVGIIQFFSMLDNNFLRSILDFVLTGSILGLLLAYVVKAYALANNSIEAGFQRIDSAVDDISLSLGTNKTKMFFKIHFPLMKTSILTSLILVISEIIKELPATLILRPFNFDTLAVTTYIYAAEERMFEAATPAMMIVLIGLIPIFFLSKIIKDSRPGSK
tara:strand:- start:1006 stop:2634 length:1629 start_codon:yes stop_codon:yes gene_type:complete